MPLEGGGARDLHSLVPSARRVHIAEVLPNDVELIGKARPYRGGLRAKFRVNVVVVRKMERSNHRCITLDIHDKVASGNLGSAG